MNNNSLQGSLQEAIRSALGCANTFEGDLHALCDLYGIANGHQDARLIGAAQKHDSTIGTASGALNYFLLNPSTLPTFGLNFVDGTGRLDSRVTFTRASSGTRFDNTGTLVSMSNDQPRFDYDPVTLAIKGLLIEEQRTNLLLQSAAFDDASWSKTATVTANQAVAPDGTNSADQLSSTGADQLVEQIASATAGTAYTLSLWVKTVSAAATLDIKLAKNSDGAAFASQSITTTGSWQRVSLTGTVPVGETAIRARIGGGSTFSTGETIYAWGAQLEAGSFATSYIPTTTAAATRAADVAVVSSLAGWFASPGTLVGEFLVPNDTATAAFGFSTGAFANTFYITTSGTQVAGNFVIGGVAATTSPVNAPVGVNHKFAMRMAASNCRLCVDGTLGAVSTAASVPAFTQMGIGIAPWDLASNHLNGYVKRLAFYPSALPDATLQALTS